MGGCYKQEKRSIWTARRKPYATRRNSLFSVISALIIFGTGRTYHLLTRSWNYQPVRAGNASARLIGWVVSRDIAELSKTPETVDWLEMPCAAMLSGKSRDKPSGWRIPKLLCFSVFVLFLGILVVKYKSDRKFLDTFIPLELCLNIASRNAIMQW